MNAPVTVISRTQEINVTRPQKTIAVVRRTQEINVTAEVAMLVAFTPFLFTATEGQTVFTLAKTPKQLMLLAINGIAQRTTDYTINGKNITLASGVNAGDSVFGVYQEL